LEELKLEPVEEKLKRYNSNGLRYLTTMNSNSMAKILLNCRPIGRIRLERSLKRLLDEAETGLLSFLNEGITMCLEIKYYNISVRQHNLIIYL